MKWKNKYLLLLLLAALLLYFIYPAGNCSGGSVVLPEYSKMKKIDNCRAGVILINTGTPSSLTKESVKCFIGDMLSDPYVMGMPTWIRTTLARKIIAPLRASSSLKNYAKIWGKSEYSPLLLNTLELVDSIEKTIPYPVTIAMRYGSPTINQAIQALEKQCPDLEKVILLPLFPHYAESSYKTAVEAVMQAPEFATGKYSIKVIEPYYNASSYIEALAERIKSCIREENYHLVFSYHSLPMDHIEAGKRAGNAYDYAYQCRETARLLAGQLGMGEGSYSIAYASAMGRKWLGPMLEEVLATLPVSGTDKVAVISPGFIIDNLETLYDLNINARETFISNGGKEFVFIPCLNDSFYKPASVLIREAVD